LRSIRDAYSGIQQREGIFDRVLSKSNYLAAIIDANCNAETSSKGPNVMDLAIFPEHCVSVLGCKSVFQRYRIDKSIPPSAPR